MSEKQPRLRLIDANELQAMLLLGEKALKMYIEEVLIPDLSSPEKTRELISEVWEESKTSTLNGKEFYINSLIKE